LPKVILKDRLGALKTVQQALGQGGIATASPGQLDQRLLCDNDAPTAFDVPACLRDCGFSLVCHLPSLSERERGQRSIAVPDVSQSLTLMGVP
jgi:hypothetical protein